ncbi:MAG: trypsin-like serine protease, partial [Bdellovibrionota bacterium]|nr:trypsin-like serine protease [Bdellovibrionota bacterium]
SITLDDGWIRILKLKLYETFNVLTRIQQRELDNITEYDEYSYDYAQVVLKESLKETEIIRPINEDIILDNDLPDGSKVILVGFGSQLSEEESEDEDEEEYEEEEEELDPNYGVKMKTELPLAGIIINDSGLFAIVAGENHGACEGDSGGAAYIKFPNGKVKYLGIITAGGDRCGESVLWTNGDSSVQGNTIINIKLDPESI